MGLLICELLRKANPRKEDAVDLSVFSGEGWEYILQKCDLENSLSPTSAHFS